jgi:uncharacterized coiled-coil protein SlyX
MGRQPSNASKAIEIEVSPGELFDRISILEIKQERMRVAEQLNNIEFELGRLREAQSRLPKFAAKIRRLADRLKSVNESLWDIEDEIRGCEAAQSFGPRFIELARSVYRENDQRAALKREINDLLGSAIVEEKSYHAYPTADGE